MKKKLRIFLYLVLALVFFMLGQFSSYLYYNQQLANKEKSLQTYIATSDELNNINNKLYASSEQAYKTLGECVINQSVCNWQQSESNLKTLNDESVTFLSIKSVLVKLEAKYPHDPNLGINNDSTKKKGSPHAI